MRCKHCGHPKAVFVQSAHNVDKYRCIRCRRTFFVEKMTVLGHNSIPYICFPHQNKELPFVNALSPGFQRKATIDSSRVRFVLTDTDIMGRVARLRYLRQRGARLFFVYPHSARPNLINDIFREWQFTTAQFVVSEGHAEILKRYNYSKPLHVVGWHLCPTRRFKPSPEIVNVLFAPIHPRNAEIDKDVNRRAYESLCELARRGSIQLTVRFIRSLSESGIYRVEQNPHIIHVQGNMDLSFDQIDRADVVVGHQTFAYLAVARGKPTVMIGEDIPTHITYRNGETFVARHFDDYKDLLMYPYDLLHTGNPRALLERAGRDDVEIADWRSRMIGKPFNPAAFVELIESYL